MTTLLQPAAARQPFAPINGSRLQSLTSLKNRQNALPTTLSTPTKRKAAVYDRDAQSSYSDDENIDPTIFASPKRSKGQDGISNSDIFKPFQKQSQFILTKAPSSPTDFSCLSPPKPNLSRPMLQPRSPAPRLSLNATHSNLSAPAGRSPTRKRIGILNRRRTASTSTSSSTFGSRVDPPSFGFAGAAAPPFSLAAALSGSIPASALKGKKAMSPSAEVPVSLLEPESKTGWFFEIHEDTEEELQHNLMEHGACTLDISSDEEVESRRAEQRGKENVPPMDDVSQTSGYASARSQTLDAAVVDGIAGPSVACSSKSWRELRRQKMEAGAIEVDRSPLGEMAAEEFYASGVSAEDVIFIADEETLVGQEYEEEEEVQHHQFDFTVEVDADVNVDVKGKGKEVELEEDALLQSAPAPARVLEPIERAEDGWSVWESGSAKGDE